MGDFSDNLKVHRPMLSKHRDAVKLPSELDRTCERSSKASSKVPEWISFLRIRLYSAMIQKEIHSGTEVRLLRGKPQLFFDAILSVGRKPSNAN